MSPLKYFNYESKCQKHFYVTEDIIIFSWFLWTQIRKQTYACKILERQHFKLFRWVSAILKKDVVIQKTRKVQCSIVYRYTFYIWCRWILQHSLYLCNEYLHNYSILNFSPAHTSPVNKPVDPKQIATEIIITSVYSL